MKQRMGSGGWRGGEEIDNEYGPFSQCLSTETAGRGDKRRDATRNRRPPRRSAAFLINVDKVGGPEKEAAWNYSKAGRPCAY